MTESTFLLAHDIAAGNINTAHTFNINTIDDPDTAGNLLITGFTATLSDYDNPSVVTILQQIETVKLTLCLLYTSPSPRDRQKSRMPSSA